MKGLVFEVRESEDTAQVNYSYPPDHPLYSEQRGLFARCNDVYRAGAATHDDGVLLLMQHLDLSDPPYSAASAPGRTIVMTRDEFSQYVDALVGLRERLKK